MDLTDLPRTPKRIATLFLLLESQVKSKEKEHSDLKLHATYYEDTNFDDELESIFNFEIENWNNDKLLFQRVTYNHETKLIAVDVADTRIFFMENTNQNRKQIPTLFMEGFEYASRTFTDWKWK